MEPQTLEAIRHIESNPREEIRMALSANDFVHIAGVLTNLYSDKHLAVIREYATNAYDSHIEAGNPDPILVRLPTSTNLTFEVQDFGVGLDVKDLQDIYSLYGRSTKRESNDAIGVLGLGCKAALCYAASFVVIGVKNGVKTVALVTKDEDGVGNIKILDTVSTEDRNGVTISVTVRSHEVGSFIQKSREFFSYWEPGTVLLDGQDPAGLTGDPLWLDPDIAVFVSLAPSGPFYSTNQSRPLLRTENKIIMGNVAYPFESKQKLPFKIVARVPIGAVHFTPSRESLQYTRLTLETISLIESFVDDRLTVVLTEKLDKASSNYQRAKMFMSWGNIVPPRGKKLLSRYAPFNASNRLEIKGRGWRYNANAYHQKAESAQTFWWGDLTREDFTIITDFPCQVLGSGHRLRLAQLSIQACLVLPSGNNLSILEGRPNLYTWQDILDKTSMPKATKATRASRNTTQFEVRQNGKTSWTTTLDDKLPIVYYHRSMYISSFANVQAQYVAIQPRQLNRFVRLYPTAISYTHFVEEEKRRLQESLSDDVWLSIAVRNSRGVSSLNRWLTADLIGGPLHIRDPDLRRILTMDLQITTAALEATRQGIKVDPHPVLQRVAQRYPLLEHVEFYRVPGAAAEDLLIYLNCKYDSTLTTPDTDTPDEQEN